MNNNKRPDPTQLLILASLAEEMEEVLKTLKGSDLPWRDTTIANLNADLHTVSGFLRSETLQEEYGVTDEVLDAILAGAE